MPKRLPYDVIEAWVQLTRAQQSLRQKIEADLKRAELPPLEWYDVLLELDRADGGHLRHRELFPRLLLAKYNLSRLVDRLAAQGLVRREHCEDDARGALIAITDEGRALRRRMWPVYETALNRYFASRLSQADIKNLNCILALLR